MHTIPLSELLEMPSTDAEGYGGRKVKDILDRKRSDEFYPELVESIREHGIYAPVMVRNGVFHNGHHRVAAAQDLGLTDVPYTSDTALGWLDMWPNGEPPESWCWPEED